MALGVALGVALGGTSMAGLSVPPYLLSRVVDGPPALGASTGSGQGPPDVGLQHLADLRPGQLLPDLDLLR
ncbi:hypothetical protein [Nocardioides aquaticus]|uniref:hypothetical protein n=1 Tax=Nocardioides aquaticus TaxID=160826 RepID=UPI001BD2FC04|nr:hypothetical protein [Nocardioides aquaticus]